MNIGGWLYKNGCTDNNMQDTSMAKNVSKVTRKRFQNQPTLVLFQPNERFKIWSRRNHFK